MRRVYGDSIRICLLERDGESPENNRDLSSLLSVKLEGVRQKCPPKPTIFHIGPILHSGLSEMGLPTPGDMRCRYTTLQVSVYSRHQSISLPNMFERNMRCTGISQPVHVSILDDLYTLEDEEASIHFVFQFYCMSYASLQQMACI